MFLLLRPYFEQIEYERNISVAKTCKKSAEKILNIYIEFVFVFIQIPLGKSLTWKQPESNFTIESVLTVPILASVQQLDSILPWRNL